jgi:hypothetical protein
MVLQKAVKTYPLLKWLLIASGLLAIVGLVLSKLVTDPNNADSGVLLRFLIPAALLPFIGIFFPRREVLTVELPSDKLSQATRQELQGMLDSLEEGKRKGELSQERYNKARDRIVAAMKTKK